MVSAASVPSRLDTVKRKIVGRVGVVWFFDLLPGVWVVLAVEGGSGLGVRVRGGGGGGGGVRLAVS